MYKYSNFHAHVTWRQLTSTDVSWRQLTSADAIPKKIFFFIFIIFLNAFTWPFFIWPDLSKTMNKLCFFLRIDQIEVYFVLNKPLISFILFFFIWRALGPKCAYGHRKTSIRFCVCHFVAFHGCFFYKITQLSSNYKNQN